MKERIKSASRHFLSKNFLKYLIIGVSSVVVDQLIFISLHYGLKTEPVPANLTSTLLSMIFNFTMSNFWTFKSNTGAMRSKIIRYAAIAAANYLLTNFLFYLILKVLGINPVIIKLAVTALQVTWTFLIYKFWVFKDN